MASKNTGKSIRLLKLKLTLAFTLVAALLVGGWYLVQPADRKQEVNRLVALALDENKRVSFIDVAWDIYSLYYSDQFVESEYRGEDRFVYAGLPEGKEFQHGIEVLRNKGFIVGYCDERKSPAWVAYRLFGQDDYVEVKGRPNGFETDNRTSAKVLHKDYTGSGYDRGHLAPNFGIAYCYGRKAQLETFRMSNIIPQFHTLNAGPWKKLELRNALNYTARFQDTWVITGPVYTEQPEYFDTGIPIPRECFKIIVDEHNGRIRVQAFLMAQNIKRGTGLSATLVSVNDIEQKTGFDFFPDLADNAETTLESRIPLRAW